MGLFSKILDKLGVKEKTEAKTAATTKTATTSIPKTTTVKSPVAKDSRPVAGKYDVTTGPEKKFDPGKFAVGTPSAIPMVDVVTRLEKLSTESVEKLNWKTSIVDLLKLLGLDSSFESRKELAQELGCPPEKMSDSAEMNVWLHKTVLQKIAANGGNIPKELLD
jgi:hypothetical protein